MPRISDRILRCVVYIYPDEESASSGDAKGGTGFLICVPMRDAPDVAHLFVATAAHVVGQTEAPCVRVNRADGGFETFPTRRDAWIWHPDGDDVVLLPFDLDLNVHDAKCIPAEWILSMDIVNQLDLGPGEEVFFVGRFKYHDGRDNNQPSVRFGNLAIMPVPVRDPRRGISQESFLVEARSLSGYSGSPVFVYLPAMTARPSFTLDELTRRTLERQGYGPVLLGVDWAHLRDTEAVRSTPNDEPMSEGWYVHTNSGMMAVVPAWKLVDILETSAAQDAMQRDREQWLEKRKDES